MDVCKHRFGSRASLHYSIATNDKKIYIKQSPHYSFHKPKQISLLMNLNTKFAYVAPVSITSTTKGIIILAWPKHYHILSHGKMIHNFALFVHTKLSKRAIQGWKTMWSLLQKLYFSASSFCEIPLKAAATWLANPPKRQSNETQLIIIIIMQKRQ